MRRSEHPARLPPGVSAPRPFQAENPEPEYLDEAEREGAGGMTFAYDGPEHVDTSLGVPQPTREPIATVPKDGRDVRVFWGDDDEDGRLARWREGRWFNGRRWLPGGRWVPSDEMTPLTMDQPTHWLKPPECDHDLRETPREGNLTKCPNCGIVANLMHVSRSSGQLDPDCDDPVFDRETAAA